MTAAQRVKQVHARARICGWEFRQRHLARGAWHRFQLALAAAHEAYAIDHSELRMLVEEGCATDDRGAGLEPPKQIVWISADRAARLPREKRIEIRFDAALLATRAFALVPFKAR